MMWNFSSSTNSSPLTYAAGEVPQARKSTKLNSFAFMLLALLCLQVTAAQAQNYLSKQVTIAFSYETVSSCLKKLQTKSGINISYNENEVKKYSINTLSFKDASVTGILDILFKNTTLTYQTMPDGIAVFSQAAEKKEQDPDKTITGIVTSEKEKQPIPGASVLVKGTSRGTSTDADGRFKVKVPADKQILVFSAIGMTTTEVTITGTEMDVKMTDDAKTLSGVVVVGYGTVKKKDLTGSVASIKPEEMNKLNASNFDVALVGRATGVQVVKSTGAPGAVASIRVRGGTSAQGTNEPLYVIDGIPIELGNGYGNDAYVSSLRNNVSPLASINPEDIESIDILKDASSAAIYGSRAANGVVIITTKRGRGGPKPNITFGFNSSFDNFTKKYNVLNADQYHEVVKLAYANQKPGGTPPVSYILDPYNGANTDWAKEATRTSVSNNVYLNVNGGTNDGNTLYSFSGSVTGQEGVIKFTDFKRHNLRASVETSLFDKLRVGTNINYSAIKNNGSGNGQYYTLIKYRPDVPIFDEKGNYGASPDSVTSNPYARMRQISTINTEVLLASIFGEVELLKGLRFRSTVSFNINKATNVEYTPSTDVFEIKNMRTGSRRDNVNNATSRIFDNTLTYLNSFGKHNLNLVGGVSYSTLKSDFLSIESTGFQDDNVLNHLGGAKSIQKYNSGGTISGLQSYFLRTNYNYAGKYYATFTGRVDESSKFGPNYRWGLFPSGALAWRIAEEDFLKQYPAIEDLKLRASYGKTGSANFEDFQYKTVFKSGSFYNNTNGVFASSIPNPDIRWESTYQLDVAVDFAFFKNKLRGTIGYYDKTTRDQILNRQIIFETGGRTQNYNVGDFSNKGWELQIGSDVITGRQVSWLTDLNITKYKSKVLKLHDGQYLNLREGQPIGYFEGYKTAGIFKDQKEIDDLNAKSPNGFYQSKDTRPGDFKFVDVNGDGFIGDDDYIVLGKAEPDFFGGWNNIIRYKNLELTAFFNFSVGNYLYNSGRKDLLFYNGDNNNYATDILNAWTPENSNATLPRIVKGDPNRNSRESDFFIEDASFFRLKNIQVSYVFKHSLLNKVFINSLRAYVGCTNVFTITGYKGLDPEVNTAAASTFNQGYDSNIYPQTRTITLGVNVNF
ncbi:TonB-dependent receptor [Chitinophaga defluvii]|uniref:TonB-dependent receptor n=1 Tax=Chitinophaga defluvii TaxID=3163343 RepID=A0ABV2T5U2_9BACT